jgi:predicted alpha/beta superfamily hydrolase
VWNDSKMRHFDYFPQKPFENLSAVEKDTVNHQLKKAGRANDKFSPNSDNYLKFLVKELKPLIDKKYSTFKDRSHTFIAGSSMGGLIFHVCHLRISSGFWRSSLSFYALDGNFYQ